MEMALDSAAARQSTARGPSSRARPGRRSRRPRTSCEPPAPGQGVQLTINRDIQYVAQRAIATRVREAKADSGTVIVMEAKTGRILAMATAPTFDPNNYGKAKDARTWATGRSRRSTSRARPARS